jgi:DNA adenine methylase
VFERFDKPDTFFYLDPPYYGNEKEYGEGIFCREDFIKIAALLRGLKGKFILSINDHPRMREIFRGFKVSKVRILYTCAKGGNKPVTELLISNY